VIFTKASKSEFIQFEGDSQLLLVGEKGYRSAIASLGIKEGCYYFEVEVLQPLLPMPFPDVQPAVRVGFADCFDIELELPLGANQVSYGYASTGRVIAGGKTTSEVNESYGKN